MEDGETLLLQSSDGRVVSVQKSVILVSETIAHLFEDTTQTDMMPIPLYQVDYNTLKKLVTWMVRYAQNDLHTDTVLLDDQKRDGKARCIRDWERSQFEAMSRNELFAFMNAANYLGISPLSQSSAAFVAEKLQTMSLSEAREYLSLYDDFTPEERRRIKEETSWAERR